MLGAARYYVQSRQKTPFILIILGTIFQYFPYTFSCLFTAVISVDRFFMITQDRKYKDLITPRILKAIAIVLFLCSVTNSSVITIHNMQSRRYSTRWVKDVSIGYSFVPMTIFILASLSTLVVILTHLYILYFALRSSNLKQLRKHHDKNRNKKRLTNTISCICISQLICVTPYLVFRLAAYRVPDKLFCPTASWLSLLVYCQCFCNALIILRNQKCRKISK